MVKTLKQISLKFSAILLFLLILNLRSTAQIPSNYELCREKEIHSELTDRIASDNEQIFIFPDKFSILSVDVKTFSTLWRSDLAGEINSNVIRSNNFIYLTTKLNANPKELNSRQTIILWEINRLNGTINKKIRLAGENSQFLIRDKNNLFILDASGSIKKYSPNDENNDDKKVDNNELNELPETDFSAAAINNPPLLGKLIFFSSGNLIESFDIESNVIRKIFENKNNITGFLYSRTTNSLLIADQKGWLRCLDALSRRIRWKYQTGGTILKSIGWREYFYVFSNDDFIYCFSQNNGKMIWKKRLENKENIQSLVVNDELLLKTLNQPRLTFLSLKNGRVIRQLPISNQQSSDTEKILAFSNGDFLLINPAKISLFSNGTCKM